MAYGISFIPQGGDRGVPERPRVEPVQEAVKILSLRLPRILSGALAPASLLRAPGAGGNPCVDSALGQTQQRIPEPAYQPSQMAAPGPSISGAPSGGGAPAMDPLMAAIQHLAQNRFEPGPVERAPGPTAPPPIRPGPVERAPGPVVPPYQPPPAGPPLPTVTPGTPPEDRAPAVDRTPLSPPSQPPGAFQPGPVERAPGPSLADIWESVRQWTPEGANPQDYGFFF